MMSKTLNALFLSILLATLGACQPDDAPVAAAPEQAAAEEQPAAVTRAAVAMPDRYGAEASEAVLAAGGNAVDAAIAAGFALAVTYPEAGNIGGGGFMLIYMDGEASFVDYRETAPQAADRDMYLDENGDVIPRASLFGHLAVGVPGSVAGFWEAHQRFGTLPWADLLEHAIRLAEEGFDAPEDWGGGMLTRMERYEGITNFADYFGNIEAGVPFKQPELAETLRRIAANGRDEFYEGETAELIVAEMERGDGLITMADLAAYEAKWREPIRAGWRGYDVLSAPLPSSGGFALVQLLKIRDYIADAFADVPQNSAQYVHLVAEIEKRVFADRAEYLGDPDFIDDPTGYLLDEEYIARRAAEVDPEAISMEVQPGASFDEHDTTHYSVLDRWGNAVSNTYTLNLGFGSGVVVTGAGFLLNDEMDDFSVKPGVPNAFGVVGSEANEIQPGKRMLSSMTPTILLENDEVAMVVGTPGGSTIFTSVFQAIMNIEDFGFTPEQSVASPRFHHQLLPPDVIMIQPGTPLPEETMRALGDRGYRFVEPYDYGDLQMIYRKDGDVQAASDPRNRGEARVLD